MALVIFCVALTEAMRLRRSFKLGIERPYPLRKSGWILRERKSLRERPLRERLGVALDNVLELRFRVARQVLRSADGFEEIGVLATQEREQTILEGAHPVEGQGVEIAIHAGVDHGDLLFHLQRRELRLLQ